MATYRLLRTDAGSLPSSDRQRPIEADSDRAALIEARKLIREGCGELWLGDELIAKIGR